MTMEALLCQISPRCETLCSAKKNMLSFRGWRRSVQSRRQGRQKSYLSWPRLFPAHDQTRPLQRPFNILYLAFHQTVSLTLTWLDCMYLFKSLWERIWANRLMVFRSAIHLPSFYTHLEMTLYYSLVSGSSWILYPPICFAGTFLADFVELSIAFSGNDGPGRPTLSYLLF